MRPLQSIFLVPSMHLQFLLGSPWSFSYTVHLQFLLGSLQFFQPIIHTDNSNKDYLVGFSILSLKRNKD
ncbi:hypothetical protein I3842_11G019600 [Carya illinoinensis]|uniref:Uncharacterized protein n=1 Tax=Carya illinoinensis TaxID=32201 RepID=A0A922IXD3_CARIL|nr:hypothetical protein I3842_11G019600 [Carya illinoinensis]